MSRVNKKRLIAMKGIACHWCKTNTLPDAQSRHPHKTTVDHVIPLALRGTDTYDNCVIACHICNQRRASEQAKGLPEGALIGNFNPKGMTKDSYAIKDPKVVCKEALRTCQLSLERKKIALHNLECHAIKLQKRNDQLKEEIKSITIRKLLKIRAKELWNKCLTLAQMVNQRRLF